MKRSSSSDDGESEDDNSTRAGVDMFTFDYKWAVQVPKGNRIYKNCTIVLDMGGDFEAGDKVPMIEYEAKQRRYVVYCQFAILNVE